MLIHRRPKLVQRSARCFTPTLGFGKPDMQLEPRLLTAPAFWRRYGAYNPDPAPGDSTASDFVTAAFNAIFNPEPGAVWVDLEEFSAHVAERSVATGGTGDESTLVGQATASAVDYSQTYPPFAPIGTYTIDENAAVQLGVTSVGNPTFNFMTLGGQVARTYDLADDSASPAPATLVEYVEIHYTPAGVLIGPGGMQAGAGSAEGLGVGVTGDNTGITTFNITGVGAVAIPSSGTVVTSGGTTITYSVSSSVVIATGSTPVGTLPTATWISGTGTVTSGLTLHTGVQAGLVRGGFISENAIAGLTAHYDAHFI